jgi:hypothetical protein
MVFLDETYRIVCCVRRILLVIPAKAEASFNSEAGQSSDFSSFDNSYRRKTLDPGFRWDDGRMYVNDEAGSGET